MAKSIQKRSDYAIALDGLDAVIEGLRCVGASILPLSRVAYYADALEAVRWKLKDADKRKGDPHRGVGRSQSPGVRKRVTELKARNPRLGARRIAAQVGITEKQARLILESKKRRKISTRALANAFRGSGRTEPQDS